MKEFSWKSLHFITKLILIATALHLAGDTIVVLKDAARVREGQVLLIDWLTEVGHEHGYSLLFLGSAGTVELLYRIWREFRLLRVSGATATERPDSSEPPTPA